ncbi:MAG: hypothetical protein AAGF53_06550 [Pseudomonadota bacterium]
MHNGYIARTKSISLILVRVTIAFIGGFFFTLGAGASGGLALQNLGMDRAEVLFLTFILSPLVFLSVIFFSFVTKRPLLLGACIGGFSYVMIIGARQSIMGL